MSIRKKSMIRKFRKDEDGAIAIEFAFVTPIIAGLFLATLDLGATGFTQNKLSSSLRFAAQYVANGGENLNVAENVFGRSFGTYRAFSSAVSCSCARSRGTFSEDAQAPTTQEQVEDVLVTFTGNTSDAPQCEKSCGEDPTIRYLTLTASAERMKIWGGDDELVSNSVSVRLK